MVSNSDPVPLSPRDERRRNARLESAARSRCLQALIAVHRRPDETKGQTLWRLLELTSPEAPRNE